MLRSVLALVLGCVFQVGAHAQATYQFTFRGTGTHLWNFYECGGAPDYNACAFGHGPYVTELPWDGTLSITTRGSGDGVYLSTAEPSGLLTFEMASNLVGFRHTEETQAQFGVEVTVQDHRVTSINGGGLPSAPVFDPYTTVSFEGLTASFSLGGCHHCGEYRATATLQAVVAAVPEPDTTLLLLAGLGIVGATCARRQAARTAPAA